MANSRRSCVVPLVVSRHAQWAWLVGIAHQPFRSVVPPNSHMHSYNIIVYEFIYKMRGKDHEFIYVKFISISIHKNL